MAGGIRRTAPTPTSRSRFGSSWRFVRAKNAGIQVPKETIDDAIGYVKRCFIEKHGAFSYEAQRDRVLFSTAAEGLLSMQVCAPVRIRRRCGAPRITFSSGKRKSRGSGSFTGCITTRRGWPSAVVSTNRRPRNFAANLLMDLQNEDGSWHGRHGQEREAGRIYCTRRCRFSVFPCISTICLFTGAEFVLHYPR